VECEGCTSLSHILLKLLTNKLEMFFLSKFSFIEHSSFEMLAYLSGDMTLSIMTLSIMTLNTQHNDIQHNDTQHNDTQYDDTQQNDFQHNKRLLCDTQHK
jgi:hypothetical protein